MKIAVIGSGIAGLSATWFLGEAHEVHLFERRRRLGMAADSLPIEGGIQVDVPLRVFYQGYYENLSALYREAGVDFHPVDYSSGMAVHGRRPWFRYHNLLLGKLSIPWVGLPILARRRSRRLLRQILQFFSGARRDLTARLRGSGQTFGDYIEERGWTQLGRDFLVPIFSPICTCSFDAVRNYPAEVLVDYQTRGLFLGGVYRARGGANEVVERLSRRATVVHTEASVAQVTAGPAGAVLRDTDGHESHFDHVIIATQANQAKNLLAPVHSEERELLATVPYESSEVVVHRDMRLNQPRRQDWAPVNVLLDERRSRAMATIWMNAVQPELAKAEPVFQTWNPLFEPRPELVLGRASFERPVVTHESLEAIRRLGALRQEPGRRLWFTGSYAEYGVPLLESAVTSSRVVARLIR